MEVRTLTIDQLAEVYRLAFDQVCNPADWRGPIHAVVPWEVASIYLQAVEFFTGVQPMCERKYVDNRFIAELTCKGYRNGPAGG